jgi:hypothetical protein
MPAVSCAHTAQQALLRALGGASGSSTRCHPSLGTGAWEGAGLSFKGARHHQGSAPGAHTYQQREARQGAVCRLSVQWWLRVRQSGGTRARSPAAGVAALQQAQAPCRRRIRRAAPWQGVAGTGPALATAGLLGQTPQTAGRCGPCGQPADALCMRCGRHVCTCRCCTLAGLRCCQVHSELATSCAGVGMRAVV